MSAVADLEALAHHVRARRVELGMTAAQLASRMGLKGPKTIYNIENGSRPRYSENTYARLDSALSWAPGSALRITEGGTPTPVAGAPSQAARRAADLTDEELLAEISFRLTGYARELDDLRSASAAAGSVAGSVVELPRAAPVPPVGVAADDPGVPSRGQQIEDFYSGLGEESQE